MHCFLCTSSVLVCIFFSLFITNTISYSLYYIEVCIYTQLFSCISNTKVSIHALKWLVALLPLNSSLFPQYLILLHTNRYRLCKQTPIFFIWLSISVLSCLSDHWRLQKIEKHPPPKNKIIQKNYNSINFKNPILVHHIIMHITLSTS